MLKVGDIFLGRLVIGITDTTVILNCSYKKDITIKYKLK